ncbi:MAG TPA: 2-hydroxycyclohexanecarboxyl-CoA dehydrogenase [Chloroflexi bacterium]|nr:2-hydroxycyclohexanecarboxyl-CoA dehydrogenase [Chloroflexota bacterium]
MGRGSRRHQARRRPVDGRDPHLVLGSASRRRRRSPERGPRQAADGQGVTTALLAKQVAIVTGGGRGFGRAIADTLAALGANVVVASRNAPELDEVANAIKKQGGKALAQTADIADERQVQELVLATERWVGPPTILVNNAGVLDPIGPLVETSGTMWLRNIAINVGGTYLATRAVLPGMLDRDYGRIVNISSGAADRPSAGWSAYCAARAAVDQLTRVLALEMEGSGVSVSAFHLGFMDTAMQERIRQSTPEQFPRVEELREAHRQGRVKDPHDPARVVAYLCLPATERNGAILEVGDAEVVGAAEAALPAATS